MNNAIRTYDLSKSYGTQRGVAKLNLLVQQGEVFGYLGPNGAGKTTTIRLLLDFIRPTSGRAEVMGLDTHKQSVAIHRQVSYLPGELVMYDTLTGAELLRYFAHLRGGVDWAYVRTISSKLGLDLSRPIRTLSKGNKQKVGLVQAFMNKPALLILDEPTSGLDPLVQQTFYELIREAKAEGRTVFLSSHVMAEVEAICDRVAIIRQGEIIAVDDVKTLKRQALRRLEITFGEPVELAVFEQLATVRSAMLQEQVLQCTVEGSVDQVIKTAARYEVVDIVSNEGDLEDTFLTYYHEEAANVAA